MAKYHPDKTYLHDSIMSFREKEDALNQICQDIQLAKNKLLQPLE